MLTNVIIFVALAIPGYILVKTKTLKAEQSIALSKLLMWVGMPFLVLSSVVRLEFSKTLVKGMATVLIVGAVCVAGIFFLSALLTKKEGDKKKQGVMRFAMIFSNNGFLGLPLAAAVLGETSEAYFYLVILNVLTNLLMYTVGIYLISGDKSKMSFKKAIFNPVLISFVLGILLNVLNVEKHLPQVMTFSDHFKNIVTPISMTILGMKMGSIKFTSLFTSKRTYFISVIKLLVAPVIFVGTVCLVDLWVGVGSAMAYALLISFGTPVAGLSSTFADAYDGDIEGASAYTLGSTALSVATLPVLYLILNLIL